MRYLLEASSISKAYSGVRALKCVSFDLLPGEVHAVVGENGAGKSTLIKIVTGAVAPDSGTLRIAGRIAEHHNPTQAHALGIAAVYQQPALFPDLTVAENIALAIEAGGVWRRIDWKARARAAREALARAGAEIHPDARVSTLSMPEQQIVEIAKAIGARAKILILDEPTASLTSREVERLFQVIAALRAEGAGIVYISHRLEEIAAIADRVTVLRDGETIATCDAKGLSRAELIRMMVGREIETIFPKRAVPIGEVALEVRNLGSRAAGIRGVSLEVRAGEILGFSGLVGSGRTQLAETIFGLTPAESGEIILHGRAVRIASPADAIRHKIGYVPEDRRQHGVVMSMPICANISLADLPAVCGHGLMDRGLIHSASESALARTYVERLRVKTHSIHAEASSLSGGNQQKVALARWLAIQPAILILDEPTQGVDVGSKSEIHGLIVDLAQQGLAIIMISSELPEILGMSDRIAVMHAGKIAGVLSRAEATQENLLALALGHGMEGGAGGALDGSGGSIDNVA
jgi:rhamnose transport system ATP-binding protein